MATLLQLQAETWWGREVVTPEMVWLGNALCARYRRPLYAAGSKGDEFHLNGSHRSQEWIFNSRYCTNRLYTVQSSLTVAQLRHVAGFDFTPGSATLMVELCQRLDKALKAGQLEEVREFYGNVDGDLVVDGWNNVLDRAASSDSSHLWHFHLSIDRRLCDRQDVMEKIYTATTGEAVTTPLTSLQTSQAVWIFHQAIDGKNLLDNFAIVKRGVEQLLARPIAAGMTDEQVAALGTVLAAAVVEADNPLGEDDQPAIEAAVLDALKRLRLVAGTE